MENEINVCGLKSPAKCTRAQIHYSVPFAESKECNSCEYQTTLAIVYQLLQEDKTCKNRV